MISHGLTEPDMSHFEPPIKDMLFALDEFIGLEKLNQIEGLESQVGKQEEEIEKLKVQKSRGEFFWQDILI